jgi:hypothetical protein
MELKNYGPLHLSTYLTLSTYLAIAYAGTSGLVHRIIFWKNKNIKLYLSCPKIPEKYSTPSTGTKCKKHSFSHTFCAEIKEG